MTAIDCPPTEDQARANYAKWFVREHFLPQDYATWRNAWGGSEGTNRYNDPNSSMALGWERILEKGALRWPTYDEEAYKAAQKTREDWLKKYGWERSPDYPSVWRETYATWWRIELADIDLEINDDNPHVKHAKLQRKAYQDRQLWQWLLKEAEYQRVYWEALVRSFGVDVKAP